MTGVPKKLSEVAIETALQGLEGWVFDSEGHTLKKTFQFADFKEAFAFMTRVALLAEEECHHPEWFNVYNVITVKMTTHDAGGVTNNDLLFAEKMNAWS